MATFFLDKAGCLSFMTCLTQKVQSVRIAIDVTLWLITGFPLTGKDREGITVIVTLT